MKLNHQDYTVENTFPWVSVVLPGPDRRRTERMYSYRLTYRNPNPEATGCVSLWQVVGGRTPYQLALERDDLGTLHLHCTCADSVFRSETHGRFCKHASGLLRAEQRGLRTLLPAAPRGCIGA